VNIRFGIYASKSRSDFPGEEIRLDSLLALRSAEPCPLVAHTDFSTYIPNLGEKKIKGIEFLLPHSKYHLSMQILFPEARARVRKPIDD
jgi:hypothetical protein